MNTQPSDLESDALPPTRNRITAPAGPNMANHTTKFGPKMAFIVEFTGRKVGPRMAFIPNPTLLKINSIEKASVGYDFTVTLLNILSKLILNNIDFLLKN